MRDKAFNIAKNPKYDGYHRVLTSMVYRVFDKENSAMRANKFAGAPIKNEHMSDNELAEESHKPIMIKFLKRNVYSPFIENMWGNDTA